MDPNDKTAAVQPGPAPYLDGDHWVYPNGRRLARVAGGEIAAPPAAEGVGAGEGGAGGEAQGGGSLDELYDLSTVPEELRPVVEPIIRQVQGNVTKRFQEHADFRKQWEPFSQVDGLADVQPDELNELLQFRQVASDPEQFDDWLTQIALAIHENSPERFETIYERLGTEAGLLEDEEGDGEGEGDGQVEQVLGQVRELLERELGPIKQQLQAGEAESRVSAAQQQIASDLEKVGAKHQEQFGEELGEDAQLDVKRLAFAYGGDDDAIERAYGDYLRITGQAQGDLVDDKLGQPKPGPSGGTPDASPETFSFGDPRLRKAAEARMRGT